MAAKEGKPRKHPVLLTLKKTTPTLKNERTARGEKQDKKREAMPAGVRISKSGKKYTETRANRSDKPSRY